MTIGIFTYGSRGDVQPFLTLAIELKKIGYNVLLGAPENFKDFIEQYSIEFHKISGNVEAVLYESDIQKLLESGNTFSLINKLQKSSDRNFDAVCDDLYNGCVKVDYIITSTIPLFYISSIAEKLDKKFINISLNPPLVKTSEYPFYDLDFLNFGLYNKFSFNLINLFIWLNYKKRVNKLRVRINLPIIHSNPYHDFDRFLVPTLFAFSQYLIKRPKDWKSNYKITGSIFFTDKTQLSQDISTWLSKGKKPIYIGFGSIPLPNKMIDCINYLITCSNERIIICKGWSKISNLESSDRLLVIDSINHELLFPQCSVIIFHGGAGTLSAALKAGCPTIIVSIFADQPTWGKIIHKNKLGYHIPIKKLTCLSLTEAILQLNSKDIKSSINTISELINKENGINNLITEIEKYFKINKEKLII